MRCGLLGRKLGHSYSPQIHALLGEYPYDLFEKEPEEVEDFLKNGDFTAINVTIPYKKTVLPYCDELTDRAKAMGAVNTLVRTEDGKLLGHNTDFYGFSAMLDKTGLSVEGKKALVLGSGGASNTAVAVLRERSAEVIVISRSGEDNYENLSRHADAFLIVNATPVGMFPHNGTSPVDLSLFPGLAGVLDMIYNPARTRLLMDAEKRGLVTENGLWMLVAQAKEAAEWFTGKAIADEKIPHIHAALRRQMENIVLIGMPGCGKSTVGPLLAWATGKTFVDSDAVIAENAEMSIPEIFAQDEEEGFRTRETAVLTELGKQSGIVLATGGGCVTKPENYDLLRQNGTLFWLRRDLSRLPTDGRPLSQREGLAALYEKRKPLYEAFADHSIDNNGSCDDTLQQILQFWEDTP